MEARETEASVEEGRKYHLHELSPFVRRSVRLPFDVDASRTEAEVTHGVLRVRVYESEASKPLRVTVKGEASPPGLHGA